MKSSLKTSMDSLHLSDIYSLMLFLLYKIQDIPEYATLSELCYLLDGSNITRLFTYFAGKTITIPTEEEFVIMSSALLMYQYVNLNNLSLVAAQEKLSPSLTAKQKEKIMDLYLKILPIIKSYNINRGELTNRVY